MTDREKLIELLNNVGSNIMQFPTYGFIEHLADYLLSNGVTVQQWIPVSEPPEVWRDENGDMVNYFVNTQYYGVDIANYMAPAKCWLSMGFPINVTHWMPMPKPPLED